MRVLNFENENRKFVKTIDNFHVLEYVQDASVSPMSAKATAKNSNTFGK